MRFQRHIAAPFFLALLFPAVVAGQSGVSPGDTVRVREAGGGAVVTGIVQWASPTTLRLTSLAGGVERTYTPGEVEEVERSRGERRRFFRNLGITVGVTSLVGGAVAAMTWSPCTSTEFLGCLLHPDSRGDAFGFGIAAGAVVGLPLGILFGLAKSQDWERVSFGGEGSEGSAVTLRPLVGRQVGLQLSVPLGGR